MGRTIVEANWNSFLCWSGPVWPWFKLVSLYLEYWLPPPSFLLRWTSAALHYQSLPPWMPPRSHLLVFKSPMALREHINHTLHQLSPHFGKYRFVCLIPHQPVNFMHFTPYTHNPSVSVLIPTHSCTAIVSSGYAFSSPWHLLTPPSLLTPLPPSVPLRKASHGQKYPPTVFLLLCYALGNSSTYSRLVQRESKRGVGRGREEQDWMGKREMEGRGGGNSLGREPIQLQAAVQPWFLWRH